MVILVKNKRAEFINVILILLGDSVSFLMGDPREFLLRIARQAIGPVYCPCLTTVEGFLTT